MIKSFKDKYSSQILEGEMLSKGISPDVQRKARMKLLQMHSAGNIEDLKVPPGNRLEKLKGDRSDQYSIRVNNQWRICFSYKDGHFFEVELIDYH